MGESFTKSMALLHTWAGVIIGSLLFAIFWFGTLSVFGSEIDRWMLPQTRIAPATAPLSLDRLAAAAVAQVPAGARQWRIDLPTSRNPVAELTWRESGGSGGAGGAGDIEHGRLIDPNTNALLAPQQSDAATGFLVPFHYSLHLKWLELGKWLVGLAAMAMLALLVSGVVVHKKIFRQLFTFRPHKRLQRSALDLHNLTGVVALPFHFMIALTGLIIFITIYFPQLHAGAYGIDTRAKARFMAEAYGKYARPPANVPGQLGSIDAMRATAQTQWGGGAPYFVRVFHPGDANSYVQLRRSYASDVTMNLDQIFFDAHTGRVLARFTAGPVMTVQRFISGLHFIRFDHALLRWLYFAGGLAGCVMICTVFLFWLEARRAQHAKKGLAGVRVVEALTIGSVAGLVLATLVFMVANRLLAVLDGDAEGSALHEVQAFYGAWIVTFAHAWWRRRAAWREQAIVIGVLAVLAVALNWATTGDHLLTAVVRGWHGGAGGMGVAGVDTMLLCVALAATYIARRLRTS